MPPETSACQVMHPILKFEPSTAQFLAEHAAQGPIVIVTSGSERDEPGRAGGAARMILQDAIHALPPAGDGLRRGRRPSHS